MYHIPSLVDGLMDAVFDVSALCGEKPANDDFSTILSRVAQPSDDASKILIRAAQSTSICNL